MHKSAGVPFGGILGVIIFIVFFIMGMALFYSCSTTAKAETKTKVQISLSGVQGAQALNFFIQSKEGYEQIGSILEKAYLTKDFRKLKQAADTHFSKKFPSWSFYVMEKDTVLLETGVLVGSYVKAVSESEIPYSFPTSEKIVTLRIILEVKDEP